MQLDEADLQTETFTNSQGWMAIRVTHTPTAVFAERSRTDTLQSPVIAQRECIDELREVLPTKGWQSIGVPETADASDTPESRSRADSVVVGRVEFEELVARVVRLEREIGFDDRQG